jgi:hypothetical protein
MVTRLVGRLRCFVGCYYKLTGRHKIISVPVANGDLHEFADGYGFGHHDGAVDFRGVPLGAGGTLLDMNVCKIHFAFVRMQFTYCN